MYGMLLQDDPLGSNLTCPKPLALLATIDPDWPVVRSLSVTFRPLEVSAKATDTWSPEFMYRSFELGVKVALVAFTGLAGPFGLPLRISFQRELVHRPCRKRLHTGGLIPR